MQTTKALGACSSALGTLAFAGSVLNPAFAQAAAAAKTAPPGSATENHALARKPTVQQVVKDPNILIILLDDAGYAQSDTVGGEIHTPTFSRVANSGILYNTFHATAVSSATRAALLTGRNPHHVGNGTVTEFATKYPGYDGVIPRSAATIPEILRSNGYSTVAFGKWHNTPPAEISAKGPYNHWPTGYGFDHFYGFMGGESDEYHPSLYNDTTPVEPPNDPKYQLTEDLANKAVQWLQQHEKSEPNKPFFMYWAPGAVHAPHQIFKSWADRYKGKFDSGWDAYRERAFDRQKALGWIPADTVDTPRPKEMPAWNTLSPEEKKFQARLMEVFAGFLEHTDTQAGKLVDALDQLGLRKNTLIFYVFSDNGASAEGMQGSINDLVGLNGITTTTQQQMKSLQDIYGGLDALGGPKLEEHYNAAWAWAGESPFVGTKLVAGYFGGTRVPLAVSWPEGIKPDRTYRTQFSDIDDIAATIYQIDGITPPAVFNGTTQEPLDGVSMAYSFADAKAPSRKRAQYFEFMGSRSEYADGWIASVFGPRTPWVADQSHLISLAGKLSVLTHSRWFGDTFGWLDWKPKNDHWALYNLKSDFSQAHDLAAANPAKLEALQKKFDEDARADDVYPLGAGFDALISAALGEDLLHRKQADWHFSGDTSRVPEMIAPNIRSRSNLVTVDADFPANANGVLLSLGTAGGGISLYLMDGVLSYEYNGFGLTRTKIRASEKMPPGHDIVTVHMIKPWYSLKSSGPVTVTLGINGKKVGEGRIPFTAPILFSATGTFNVGKNLGSPVSLDYFDRAPFAFNGTIHDVHVQYQ